MKELSIEEKAKAYDEALEKSKRLYEQGTITESLSYVFPELKESEDEKINNALIDFFSRGAKNGEQTNGVDDKDILAWLEKQGEKMSDPRYSILAKLIEADNIYQMSMNDDMVQEAKTKAINALSELEIGKLLEIEKQCEQKPAVPKFRIGDKVKKGYLTYTVEDIDEDSYKLQAYSKDGDKGCTVFLTIGYEKDYELVEQKPTDKVEPKFHIGDWVVSPTGVYWHIDRIENNRYEVTSDTGKCADWSLDTDLHHLWTIQDAKDGDVLFAENFDNIGGCVFLFKGLDSWKLDAEGDRAIATGYCCTSITESGNTDFGIQGPDCVEIKRVHPATKEQRDQLEKAMADAGYKWNKEELKLEKI